MKFKVCIFGAGMIANSAHIPAYKSFPEDFEIVGIFDVSYDAAKKTADEFEIDNNRVLLSGVSTGISSIVPTPIDYEETITNSVSKIFIDFNDSMISSSIQIIIHKLIKRSKMKWKI